MAVQFAEWKRIAYRGFRASFSVAVSQVLVLRPDWSDPQEAVKFLVATFVSGFLVAFGMFFRDFFKPQDTVSKVMPI